MRTLVASFLCAAALAACGGSDSRAPGGTTPVTSSTEPTEPTETEPPPAAAMKAAPAEPAKPAEPPAPTYIHGKWVWYELESSNVEKSKAFWSELLGWTIESSETAGVKYELVKAGGKEIASIELVEKKGKSHWVPYVSVPDVDAAVKAVEENKGKVVKPAQDVPQIGRFAVVADPNGAVFALFKNERSDDPDTKGPPQAGVFLWNELLTRHKKAHAASLAFYPAVIGYTTSQMQVGEGKKKTPYDMLFFAEKPRAGVAAAVPASMGGQWMPWIAVDDVDAVVAKVKTLKGKVVKKPFDVANVGRSAVVADPTGAPVGVIKPLTPEEMKAAEEAKAAAKETGKPPAVEAKDAAKDRPKDGPKENK